MFTNYLEKSFYIHSPITISLFKPSNVILVFILSRILGLSLFSYFCDMIVLFVPKSIPMIFFPIAEFYNIRTVKKNKNKSRKNCINK